LQPKRISGLIILIIFIILTLIIVKHNRFKKINPTVKKLIYASLDLQYNKFSRVNSNQILLSDFEKNTANFYKFDKWPYIITDMQEWNYQGENYINVRILDRAGEYIQECLLIKKNTTFLIKNINYDI